MKIGVIGAGSMRSVARLPSDIAVEVPTRVSGEKIVPEPLEHIPKRMYACVFYPRIERLDWL